MRRHLGAVIACFALAGCGGPTTEVALGLVLSSIPNNVRHFKIRFHAATRACDKVLNEPNVMGTVNKEANIEVLTAGGLQIDEIPPGNYVVAAIGSVGPATPPLAGGCEPVTIKEGEVNTFTITVMERR